MGITNNEAGRLAFRPLAKRRKQSISEIQEECVKVMQGAIY